MNEVMQVPEGWKVPLLAEIGEVITGSTPSTENDEYYGGSIPFIGPVDFKGQRYIKDCEKKITRLGLLQSRKIPANSILTVCIGSTIGKIAISAAESCTNQQINSLKCSDSYNFEFVYYSMKQFLQKQLEIEAGLQAVPIVNKSAFSRLLILCPVNKKEQYRIAEILSTLDRAIEASEKLIAKEKQIKKGLMSDLLTHGIDEAGRIRTPQTHRYKESELGMIPEGWEIESIGKCVLGSGEYGINAPAVDFSYTLPTYLRITDIDDEGHFIERDKKSVLAEDASEYLLEEGDIVFARTGNTTGKTYLYNLKDGPLVFAGFLIRFHPNPKKLISTYLKAITETERYWSWVQTNSARTGQPGINASEYARFRIALPMAEEQHRIASILITQDKKIETEEANLAKLGALKKGLMDDLLSGSVRV